MAAALYFLCEALGNLVLLFFILRFWLPLFRADFRNPISQTILRFTSPLINQARRFTPSIGKLDTATILITYTLQYLLILVLTLISQKDVSNTLILITAFFEIALASADLFFFAIIINVLLSWLAPFSHSPLKSLVENITEPLLRPYRKMFNPIGGLDFSPLLAIIAIQAVTIFLKNSTPMHI